MLSRPDNSRKTTYVLVNLAAGRTLACLCKVGRGAVAESFFHHRDGCGGWQNDTRSVAVRGVGRCLLEADPDRHPGGVRLRHGVAGRGDVHGPQPLRRILLWSPRVHLLGGTLV